MGSPLPSFVFYNLWEVGGGSVSVSWVCCRNDEKGLQNTLQTEEATSLALQSCEHAAAPSH